MTEYYAIYINATGQIIQIGRGVAGVAAQQVPPTGQAVIVLPEYRDDYYVDVSGEEPVLEQKTAHPLTIGATTIDADGEDECVITGIHNPSTVTWPDGFIEVVTDGEVRFSVDLAGEYAITIEAIPYLKETINVQALPAN